MSSNDFDDDRPTDLSTDLPTDEDDAAAWWRSALGQRRHRLDVLVVIAVGGVLGASARHALAQAIPTPDNGFPVATLTANVVGSFVLGFIAVVSVDVLAPMRYLRPFFAVGLIGSFTTFSTFAVENVLLVDRGEFLVAALYVPAMLSTGIAAARLGIEAARRIGKRSALE